MFASGVLLFATHLWHKINVGTYCIQHSVDNGDCCCGYMSEAFCSVHTTKVPLFRGSSNTGKREVDERVY